MPPTSSASALPRSSFRSATTTLQPAAASSRTVASPRPLAPPDTIAAVPLIFMGGAYLARRAGTERGSALLSCLSSADAGERAMSEPCRSVVARVQLRRRSVAGQAPGAANGAGGVDSNRGNPWVILIVVSLGFFMTLLDLTIVNIAIPNMISKLHASLDDILWVINAYALVLAVLLITAG